jgi:four helix bundle protein
MSNFRDLKVYQRTRALNKQIFPLLKDPNIDRSIRDQLSRATLSIPLNLAEGAGRFTYKDKKHFFIIARASTGECTALIDILEDLNLIPTPAAENFRTAYEELSRMLFGLIRALEEKPDPAQEKSPISGPIFVTPSCNPNHTIP